MKKVLIMSILTLVLCVSILPNKAYADSFSARGGLSKTVAHSTSSTTGSPGYSHTTTDIRSNTKGAYGGVQIDGVSRNDMAYFYHNAVKPLVNKYAKKNNGYKYHGNYKYNPQPSYNYNPAGYSPPVFSPPTFNPPAFNPPVSTGFSQPSMHSFNF
ncbi:MAG: hypothetical protein AB1782_04285 [Cyanobacteriota bacterium]